MPRVLRDTELLRAHAGGRPVGVDRDKGILRGYVVMQAGQLKDRPGEADELTLQKLVALGNERKVGIKSRFSHPTESDDGLGKHLGRAKNFYLDEVLTRDGQMAQAVRADLHFDKTALEEPVGGGKPLGEYVMDLAESDPDALSSSVVVRMKREYRVDKDGIRLKDDKGEELPPLLRVEKFWASDIVDEGAAVDGLLSLDELPNSILWKATEYLNKTFEGLNREELREKVSAWFDKYLEGRYGPEELTEQTVESTPEAEPLEKAVGGCVGFPPEPTGVDVSVLLRKQRLREMEVTQ